MEPSVLLYCAQKDMRYTPMHIYLAEVLKTYLKTGQNIRTGTWR